MSLESLFAETANLPNIPKVVQTLIERFNNPASDADEISRNIQMDQVLSARIMRLANSARYGAGRKVSSIDSAVVMLGRDILKTLVIASGITGAFKNIPHLDKKVFWRDCFMIASICKLTAKNANLDPETAFTCGIMHNIGELLIHIAHPEEAAQIDRLVDAGAHKEDLQIKQFTYHYAEVGAELAKSWNFPQEIVQALAQQIAPNNHQDYSPYSGIIYLAKYLNQAFKENKEPETVLSEFPIEATKPLHINLTSFFDDLIELTQAEDDIESILN